MRQDKAEKITITIPPEMLSVIKKKVDEGFYSSTSELIRAAVRLWQQREDEHEARLQAIRMRLEHSEQNGDPVPLRSAFERIEYLHKQRSEKSANG
ncbi:type II toxin-antitoxin system ParD family antitoxin [Desulfobacter vibrioformis]|uniref:type II toxin-antitoxin system ParD family antitoxin n=1 Tax=Desulfobacter vibrioformis TaxID=34031 RepID=UPI000557B661|nr:type II toxin-antitoxin system ParD family antitoxin [Desulfobacter vibrioformis]